MAMEYRKRMERAAQAVSLDAVLAEANDRFEAAPTAPDLPAIAPGRYAARLARVEAARQRDGAAGIVIYVAIETPTGRRTLPWRMSLSDAAVALTKRDLARVGIERLAELDGPLPADDLTALVAIGLSGAPYIRAAWITPTVEAEDYPFAPAETEEEAEGEAEGEAEEEAEEEEEDTLRGGAAAQSATPGTVRMRLARETLAARAAKYKAAAQAQAKPEPRKSGTRKAVTD